MHEWYLKMPSMDSTLSAGPAVADPGREKLVHHCSRCAPPAAAARSCGSREPARRPCYPTAAADRAESTRNLIAARAAAASWQEATKSSGGSNASKVHEGVGWLPTRSTSRTPSLQSMGSWVTRGIELASPAARSLPRSLRVRSDIR